MEPLQQLSGFVLAGINFLLIITVLVAVHELGHYWFARALGMKVDAFGVMMGGIRAADLSGHLERRLAPGVTVAAALGLSAVLAVAGGLGGQPVAMVAGMAGLSVIVPLWVAARLRALYHLKAATVVKTVGGSVLVALALLWFTTRFDGVPVTQALFLTGLGSWVGVLLVYYRPVLQKAEDAPAGQGVLEIGGQQVQVPFRPLWSRKSKSGTEFSLLVLPLGGFAMIHGMHPKSDASETRIEGGFYSKPPLARLVVLFAGPLFSVLLGVALLFALFVAHGQETPVNQAVVGAVVPDAPAARAGLMAGDRVTAVDGEPVATWYDLVSRVRDRPAEPIRFTVSRGGEVLTLSITPRRSETPRPVLDANLRPTGQIRIQSQIGAAPDSRTEPVAPGQAIVMAAQQPVALVGGLATLVRQPGEIRENVGGLGTVVEQTHRATETGLWSVLFLAAMLSITLGIMNLLPIPPLDGGQMVVAFIELLRGGKRLSIQVQTAVSALGMVAILMLVLGLAVLDVDRFVGR
jgi:regulator of sigma E protease